MFGNAALAVERQHSASRAGFLLRRPTRDERGRTHDHSATADGRF